MALPGPEITALLAGRDDHLQWTRHNVWRQTSKIKKKHVTNQLENQPTIDMTVTAILKFTRFPQNQKTGIKLQISYLFMLPKKQRKKRLNELEEDYEYTKA